jgi:hypothetical protein
MYGEGRGAYRVLVGKPERKRERPLGRHRHRWTMLGWIFRKWDEGKEWIELA